MENRTKGTCAVLPSLLLNSLFLTILLTGCAGTTGENVPPTVPLEEAKKITATFAHDFTPPPRTINDVTAILSQERAADLESYRKTLSIADQVPPVGKDDRELAHFYYRRALAAFDLGRVRQEREDFRSTIQHGSRTRFEYLREATFRLGISEAGRTGNYKSGIQHINKAIEMEGGYSAQQIVYYSRLAILYVRFGDLSAGERAIQSAERIFSWVFSSRYGGAQIYLACAESNIAWARGTLLSSLGKFIEGESYLRKAIASWEPFKNQAVHESSSKMSSTLQQDRMILELAENLQRQGRLSEAEFQARRAVQDSLQSHGCYSPHVADMIRGLIGVIFSQGRYAEAEALARAELDIYRRIGMPADSLPVAKARSLMADSMATQLRWSDALREYDSIQKALQADPDNYRTFISGNVHLWLSLIKGGREPEALALILPALEKKRSLLGERHYETEEARGVLAMALSSTGDREKALEEFRRVIPGLLTRANQSESDVGTQTASDFRLQMILDAYMRLLWEIRDTDALRKNGIDAVAEIFQLADAARAQKVERAIHASSARAAAKDPNLADLARREQDASMQIAALNVILSNLVLSSGEQQKSAAVKDLQSRIDLFRAARAVLMKEIRERFPDYYELVDPQPVSIENLRNSLEADEALIATYLGEGGGYVWAVPRQGPIAFSFIAMSRKQIAEVVRGIRITVDPRGKMLGDIPPFDLEKAYRLYEVLLKPVENGWKGARNLIVVTHGPLGYLPFTMLPTRWVMLGPEERPLFSNYRAIPWLARTHTVSVLPSVASFRALKQPPTIHPHRKPFVGFGDPRFSSFQIAQKDTATWVAPMKKIEDLPLRRRGIHITTHLDSAPIAVLPPLPDTADEIRDIATALRADLGSDVFLGRDASEERVKATDLSDKRIVAFATHALLPGDLNGLSQPALALSSPEVTGGKEDGLLTMGEILGLKLNADWVILSACNTGAGEGAGAEAISGLGRAFFYAGTRSLLVSNWAVETSSAKTLTTEIFRRQAADPSLNRSEALNRSMLDLIDRAGYMDTEGRMAFSYAHPVFWAPFSLVGDGG